MPDDFARRQISGPLEVSGYVAALAGELAGMARQSGLRSLAYLLEMARLEAENVNRDARENHNKK